MRDQNRCKTAETKVGGEWTETQCHQGSFQKWNPLPEDCPQQQRTLKLSGNISHLAKALQDLPQDQSAASPPSPGLPTQQCPGGEPLPQPPPPKCRHPESSADAGPSALPESETAGDPDDLPFSFSGQGQWVATYYDEQFFTGQVIEVHDPQSAVVQYLEQLKGRSNLFKWPKVEDVAETDCIICIWGDFGVNPVSSGCRVWKVPAVGVVCGRCLQGVSCVEGACSGCRVWKVPAVGVMCGRCLQWVSCVEGACSGCHPGEVWRNIQPLIKLTSSRIVFA